MKSRRARAVELLMSCSPEQTAELVGVRLETLEQWMKMDDFKDALRAREREQQRSLSRIARQAALNAAQTLCDIASDRTRPDSKILLEMIKASGALEPEAESAGDELADVMRRIREEVAASD